MLSLDNYIKPDELHQILIKYRNAGFLMKFINETICNFERGKGEMIIPEWLFDGLGWVIS